MQAYEVAGRVTAGKARERVDEGNWLVHGLVEENGRVRSVIRNRLYPEVLIVEVPDPDELPHPWPS